MKRISPDISDEAKIILDRLCYERKQTMSTVVSALIMESVEKEALEEQLIAHMLAIEAKLAQLCKVILDPAEEPTPPVQTDAERYGAGFVQPVPDLPVPEVPRGAFRRLFTRG